uniref:Uncharacterized protein n=1 Tax=Rhizophora mucronata TaxID=61149 RepID=A0A2P2K1B1_RHIMU
MPRAFKGLHIKRTSAAFSWDDTRNRRNGLANDSPFFSFLAIVSAAIETIHEIWLMEQEDPLVSNISPPAE